MRFSPTITCQYDTPFSPFSAAEFPQALLWAKSSGFDGVELCISDYSNISVETICGDLARTGLACSTLSTGQARTRENISLLHEDPAAVSAAQARLKEHIDAATILGSKVTVGLLRGLGTPGNDATNRKTLAANLAPVVDYAACKGVVLLLESINRYETCLLNSAADALHFIENDLGNPDCMGVLWDVFHANIEDPGFVDAIDLLGDRLQHLHLADSNRMFPGYGHIDFDAIIRKLNRAGYTKYLSFECLNRPSLAAVRNEAGPFIQHCRQLSFG